MLRVFGLSGIFTVVAIIAALALGGLGAGFTILVLIAIELAFSFDNAIINAKVLARLSRTWQQLFLTIGMVFAILGMRFVFPILIVMVTANQGWNTVLNEALHNPTAYAEHLKQAHPSISAFGGSFLLLLSLYFFIDDDPRKILWIKRLERPLQRVGSALWLPPLLALIVVLAVSAVAGREAGQVLRAGFVGVVAYTLIKLIIDGLGRLAPKGQKTYPSWPAFLAFMYLQLLDASFSFDGVLGAFAITDKVILIALGLGVGALWVRSLTVYLVRHGILDSYIYLEHGAHYAILVLAAALFLSLFVEVPDVITGVVGLGVIGASYLASRDVKKARI